MIGAKPDYMHVTRPPPLSWEVLSQLTHLSNVDRVPLPMIMEAAKCEDIAVQSRRESSRKARPPVDFSAPEEGEGNQTAANESRRARHFTVSKKGRTMDEVLSGGSSWTPPRRRSMSEDRESNEVRLPNYIVNPFSAVLFGSRGSEAPNTEKKTARTAKQRKRSVASGQVESSRRGSSVVSYPEELEDHLPQEFTSTTFTRHGLNLSKLRSLEREYIAREEVLRQLLDPDAAHKLEFDEEPDIKGTSSTRKGTVSPPLHRSTLLMTLSPRRQSPRTPRHIEELLCRRIDSQRRDPATYRNSEYEPVDWTSDHRPVDAMTQQHPHRDHEGVREWKLVRAEGIESDANANDDSQLQMVHCIPAPPKPLAHAQFVSQQLARANQRLRTPHASGNEAVRKLLHDSRTCESSYKPNALRELGREIRFRSS